jgi:SAM-dependent methyltransferase
MPIFRKGLGPHAVPLAMSGVKLGERLLYLGRGRPALFAALASKTGLTGRACAVIDTTREAEALQRAAAHEGVLVEIIAGSPGAIPHETGSFDVAVIDGTDGSFGSMSVTDPSHRLGEIVRVMRPGGRLVVIERVAGALRSIFGGTSVDPAHRAAGGAKAALEGAGFRPVRVLAERQHLRYTEGIKPAAPRAREPAAQ